MEKPSVIGAISATGDRIDGEIVSAVERVQGSRVSANIISEQLDVNVTCSNSTGTTVVIYDRTTGSTLLHYTVRP